MQGIKSWNARNFARSSSVSLQADRVNCHWDFRSLAAEVATHRDKWRIQFILNRIWSLDWKSEDFKWYHHYAHLLSKCSTNHLDKRVRFINDLKCTLTTPFTSSSYKVARSPWKCPRWSTRGLTTPFSSLSKKVTGIKWTRHIPSLSGTDRRDRIPVFVITQFHSHGNSNTLSLLPISKS